ncbi:hypothetical protein CEXT_618131 [Caerostris extrusa]|uniref:Uncharacterized protein n=1 Tax=Caerostris extrusa TaxID=172846 RepID=A0AAV4TB73_CAEEX|nr:hypothetical protein CEXT_618131 [Caerostris extrusa]
MTQEGTRVPKNLLRTRFSLFCTTGKLSPGVGVTTSSYKIVRRINNEGHMMMKRGGIRRFSGPAELRKPYRLYVLFRFFALSFSVLSIIHHQGVKNFLPRMKRGGCTCLSCARTRADDVSSIPLIVLEDRDHFGNNCIGVGLSRRGRFASQENMHDF